MEGSSRGLISGTVLAFVYRDWVKSRKTCQDGRSQGWKLESVRLESDDFNENGISGK